MIARLAAWWRRVRHGVAIPRVSRNEVVLLTARPPLEMARRMEVSADIAAALKAGRRAIVVDCEAELRVLAILERRVAAREVLTWPGTHAEPQAADLPIAEAE